MRRDNGGAGKGKLFVVGIGPGGKADRTHRAEQAIAQCSTVVGYKRYIENVDDLTDGKRLVSSGMTQEADRCREAVKIAAAGENVALVSSGDAGVYGMAGLAIELTREEGLDLPIEIIPGVSAANAAGARLGAPLMLDYAAISLSDLLVPWEMIRKRLEAVAAADMVVALYNPKSKKRVEQLEEAAEIFKKHRPVSTPVGVCTSVGYDGEETVVMSDLENFQKEEIGMMSIVIIGNSETQNINGWMVTPRGYKGKRY
ncbi:MAG: precorrin-3B C(17)-methyltransferase [Nitrospinae bacterium]|nr:precorrin-3B C(17)-methyltransferase [Nitrospinota bacterium]